MKTVEPYAASGDEHKKLILVTNQVLRLCDAAEMSVADMMNMLTNLMAEVAVGECIDRETMLNAVGVTYDLHLAESMKNETFN